MDTGDDDDEATFGDPPVAMANTRYPSSMGMTFGVDLERTRAIWVHPSAARYEPDGDPASATSWRRVPRELEPVPIAADQPRTDSVDLGDGLALFYRVRQPDADNAVSVTVVLVNRRSGTWPRDPDCFFQPELAARGEEDVECFVERRPAGAWTDDIELASYRLLYRHARNFAIGHGCAVDWPGVPDATHVAEVRTAVVPAFALNLADSNPDIPTGGLGMQKLASAAREDVLVDLGDLCHGYEQWIGDRRAEVADLAEDLLGVAVRHLEDCESALKRMRQGIAVLVMTTARGERLRSPTARCMRSVRARPGTNVGDREALRTRPRTTTGDRSSWPSSCCAFRASRTNTIRTARRPTCSGSRPEAERPRPTWD